LGSPAGARGMNRVHSEQPGRGTVPGVLVFTITFVTLVGFAIGVGSSEPPGGGGGGTCPTPYGPTLHIWDELSGGVTSTSITFDLSTSSVYPTAIATLNWWDGTGQSGSIGDIGIGIGPGVTESMTSLQPTTAYSWDIVASMSCTDSSGTHTYSGEATGNFETWRMVDWQTTLTHGGVEAIDPSNDLDTCTWAVNTNLTIQSVDATNSAGVWYYSTSPVVQDQASSSSSITPGPAAGQGCALFASTKTTNHAVGDLPIYYDGNVIGETFTWNPIYQLSYVTVAGDVIVTLSIVVTENYYMSPSANVGIQDNGAYIAPYTSGNTIEVLLDVVSELTSASAD